MESDDTLPPVQVGEGGFRILGMLIGGGAGMFFYIFLVQEAGLPQPWLLSVPGIGLCLGCGVFSNSRSTAWGIAAAVAGAAWMLVVSWLRFPGRVDLAELATDTLTSPLGIAHLGVIGLAAYFAAGKRRSRTSTTAESD